MGPNQQESHEMRLFLLFQSPGIINRAAVAWAVLALQAVYLFIFLVLLVTISKPPRMMFSANDVIISQLQAISQLFSSYPPSGEFC